MLNNISIIGRLVKDIEIKAFDNGNKSTRFSIANEKRISKEQKEKLKENNQETANFFNCEAWNQSALFLKEYACKGDTIAIDGRLEQKIYFTNDGQKRSDIVIVANNVEVVHKPDKNKASESSKYISEEYPF